MVFTGLIGFIDEFATNKLGFFNDAQFNDLTDWRVLALIDEVERGRRAAAEIKTPKIRKTSRPPKRAAAKQPRDASGKFAQAKQDMRSRPGDKYASREYFLQKLRRERAEGRR